MSGRAVPPGSRRFKVNVWRSLMDVHAAVLGEIERELTDRHGLSLSEFDALVNIPRDGVRLGELTQRVVLSQSATSRLIDRLERRGFVVREEVVGDSRGVIVRLTPEGRKVLYPAARTNADVIERAFADWLRPEELETLDTAFTRLLTTRTISS
jgi:DNA-binding MarR family transcriptional regulator